MLETVSPEKLHECIDENFNTEELNILKNMKEKNL